MSDIYQNAPNFVNPQYATPEQLKQLRGYSEELLKGSIKPQAKTGLGVAAALIQGIAGNQRRAEADQLQQQGIQGGTDQTSGLIAELLRQPDQSAPSGVSAPASSPDVAPQARPEVRPSATTWGDKEGQSAGIYDTPGSQPSVPSPPPAGALPPGGVQASANSPAAAPANFPQRFNGINPREIAAALQNPNIPEQSKAMIRGLITPERGADVYGHPTTASVLGGVKAQPLGPGVFPGVRTEVGVGGVKAPAVITGGAAGPAMAVPGMGGGSGIDSLAAKDRELTRLGGINAAGTGAQGGVVKEDIEFANQAPNVLKTVGAITDNIKRFGDKMTFGPTAPWSQEVKKLAANYAPGVMKDQLDSIAAADSIEKLSGNLGSLLSKQLSAGTGTDAQMLQGLKTVPGLMQSKQGALAMADMIRQAAEKQQQLGYILQDEKNWANYAKTKSDFFAQHPVINPLTGHSLEMDIKAAQDTKTNGGWSIQPVKK